MEQDMDVSWVDVGSAEELSQKAVQQVVVNSVRIALSFRDGVAHSRGWTAEDMERNVANVQSSEELRLGCRELIDRSTELAGRLLTTAPGPAPRGGRKGRSIVGDGR